MMFSDANISSPIQALGIAIFIAFTLLICSKQSHSQNSVTNQIWLDFNPSYQLSDKFDLTTKAGFKAAVPNVWYKYYFSGEVDYNGLAPYKSDYLGSAEKLATSNVSH